jgi:alkylation response protein AidB-like acyl-CoA dehydrogenase
MPAQRLMPTDESSDLIELTRSIVDKELRPVIADLDASATFPRDVFRTLGRAGLLSLPYPEEVGGGDQSYEVYLQASYLRPILATSGTLRAVGRVVKGGRRVIFAEGVLEDAEGRPLATATSSLLVLAQITG